MNKIVMPAGVAGLLLISFMITGTASAAVEKTTNGFVCPVIKTDAVLNSPNGGTLGGSGGYTIGGPDVSTPFTATNDDGAGSPGGDHLFPGDPGYTAVWSGETAN